MAKGPAPAHDLAAADNANVAVVVSRYNWFATGPMLEGARAEFARVVGGRGELTVLEVPGSFELTAAAAAAALSDRFDAVVCLGCLVKGETRHDEFIAHAVAQGLAGISAQTGKPIGFGVLTVNTPEQARERSGGTQGNKGAEAMLAALQTLATLRSIEG
ncbi:MAG: 6,7-dimethyl-8-ribityllumazine synthase [Phycisphaerales bacterium]|nr:6,7-dimethyl-8-ribityllumazine synthase [Phycisphaerales bacterium]